MKLLRRLRYWWRREQCDAELQEELAFHTAMAEREQEQNGAAGDEVRRAAARQMGNATLAREAAHYVWIPEALEGCVQDLRYAWRGLGRSWTLLIIACLSLGLSTGFGTALFSVVNAVILQPVSASEPDQLVRFWVGAGNRTSWLNLRDLCEDTPGVQCAGHRVEEVSWRNGSEPVRVFSQIVSPNYFSVLGVAANLGRVFTTQSVQDNPDAVVVTHAFWQRRLQADPQVIGRKLVLGGHPYTVTAVLPPRFRSLWGLGIAPSIYLPAGSAVRPPTTNRSQSEYELIGRSGADQGLEAFRSRLHARAKYLETTYPKENRDFARVQVWRLHPLGLFASQQNDSMLTGLLVFASALMIFVLLLTVVACLNVAGLLIARALSRQREIAVRLSLGCGRLRLARLLFAESFLLSCIGIGLGAILSYWLARLIVAVPLPFPAPFEIEVPVDTHLLAFLAGLTGLATLTAGLAPVLQAWRMNSLGETSRGPRAVGLRSFSLRATLTAAQVAVSTVLLISTTLFVRSLWTASRIDPGFDLDHVVTVELDPRGGLLSEAEAVEHQKAVIQTLRDSPRVSAVSGALVVPLTMSSIVNSVQVEDQGGERHVTTNSNHILPDYFRVLAIPFRAGRDFRPSDQTAKPAAAIINETFARTVFPGRSAVGHRIRRPPSPDDPQPWAEVVGVVADTRYLTLGENPRPLVYWPRSAGAAVTLHVRTEEDPTILARDLPQLLRTVNPRVPVRASPLRAVMATALFPAQAAAVLLAALGLIGWALTIAGLYGVVAYTVTRRVPEIGVRMALGATPASVVRMVLRSGMAIALSGLLIGLGLAAAATPLLSMFLAGTDPRDRFSYAAVAAALLVTALLAIYGPARRGARIAPMQALRTE